MCLSSHPIARLLRKSNKTDSTVFSLILNAAEAYKEAGAMMSSSSSCIFHARFLKALVEREVVRARQQGTRDLQDGPAIDPALQDVEMTTPANSMSTFCIRPHDVDLSHSITTTTWTHHTFVSEARHRRRLFQCNDSFDAIILQVEAGQQQGDLPSWNPLQRLRRARQNSLCVSY